MIAVSSPEAAHDLNNLLTAIIGAAEAALHRPGLDPETREDLAHILEGARRGTALVRDFRGSAEDAPRPIWVNETIRATSRLLSHRLGPGIALTLTLAEPDAQVKAVPWALDRVLLNLIANARHAMPSGGTVTVTSGTRIVATPEPRVPDTIPAGRYLVIRVADTGIGIPPDQVPRIFTPGFTTRGDSGGTGLGLSSVRDVVRESNGFIAIDSVEWHGTKVEIYLPYAGEAPAAPVSESRTVLLVDDDPLVLRVAERVLRRAGWTVLTAGSAEDALEILNGAPCDLLISDVAMPGMDGVALARLALAHRPELPVILTSGYERGANDETFPGANVTFLTKPYGQEELLDEVRRIV